MRPSLKIILVPRDCDPFGQHQESGPVASPQLLSMPRELIFICQPIRFERNILQVFVESPWVADFPPGLPEVFHRPKVEHRSNLTTRIAATDTRMLRKVQTNLAWVLLFIIIYLSTVNFSQDFGFIWAQIINKRTNSYYRILIYASNLFITVALE